MPLELAGSFEQLLCVLGSDAAAIREQVDLSGVEVIENRGSGQGGCSSSIAAALGAVDRRSDVLVLLPGDKGVWELLLPLDVDTWDDYTAVLAQA